MSKPKILYLSTSLNIGGTEKFLVTLLRHLSPRYDIRAGYLKVKGYWGGLLETDGVAVCRFDGMRSLVRYLRDNRIDLLHTFLYRANILGRVAGRLAGVPAVVSTQQAIDAWKRPHHVWADRLTARWCDAIIANSAATKSLLTAREKIAPGKITVVYNGIDHDRFRPATARGEMRKRLGIPGDAVLVVSVMRLHREKGADYLPLIAEKVPYARFLVVGEGPDGPQMKREVADRDLGQRFIFSGWRQDIPDILNAADIFLLPSREESFPQAILEAMSAGLPVVAARTGGVGELVENDVNGYLAEPGSTDDFVAALNTLVADPEAARRMGEAGRAKSLPFGEDRMVSETDALYRRLLQDNGII